MSDKFEFFATKVSQEEHENVQGILLYTSNVQYNYSNLNSYSDHQCLQDYFFIKEDIGV